MPLDALPHERVADELRAVVSELLPILHRARAARVALHDHGLLVCDEHGREVPHLVPRVRFIEHGIQ